MNPRKSTGSSEFDEFVEDKYEGYTFIQKRYGLRLTCWMIWYDKISFALVDVKSYGEQWGLDLPWCANPQSLRYKTGLATTQEAYEENVFPVFKSLDRLENILKH